MLIKANYYRHAPLYPIGYDDTLGTTPKPLIFRNSCLLKRRLKDNFVFNSDTRTRSRALRYGLPSCMSVNYNPRHPPARYI